VRVGTNDPAKKPQPRRQGVGKNTRRGWGIEIRERASERASLQQREGREAREISKRRALTLAPVSAPLRSASAPARRLARRRIRTRAGPDDLPRHLRAAAAAARGRASVGASPGTSRSISVRFLPPAACGRARGRGAVSGIGRVGGRRRGRGHWIGCGFRPSDRVASSLGEAWGAIWRGRCGDRRMRCSRVLLT
jgi:hypothetical protein